MGEKKLLKKLVKTIILLVETRNLLKDEFFKNKLENRIFSLGENFFKLGTEENKNNIYYNQRLAVERFLVNIFDLLEILKELSYLNLAKNDQLFLEVEISLLDLKLIVLKNINVTDYIEEKSERSIEGNNISQSEMSSIAKSSFRKDELTETKKKILNFVKSYPNSRTKDIIYELSNFSGRTIKRNLTDLLKVGFIKKRVDNKAVYYYASE